MEEYKINVGDIIKGPRWPEPVEIKKIEKVGGHLRIIGSLIHSGGHIDQLLGPEELKEISTEKLESDFKGYPLKVFLALEAKRYRFASEYDPLLAMNTSKIDPLPHQIEAVYGYILRLPRIRFLIADDPGAGKTIMAGLIIKELKLRKIANRILIVVPGHLKDQWRRELKEKFEEHFVVVDRGFMDAHYGENVWERENQIITSIDFAKRDDILPTLSNVHFDLVIVDEAHKMSAYRYGDKTHKTSRYKLGEVLSRNAEHLLFLTATPHKGDPENFRLFLDLLVPGFFATQEMLLESIKNRDNPLFIRRIKEDLRDFQGKPLFLPRYVETIPFKLSEEEKRLYNAMSAYVKEQYNKALSKVRNKSKKRNVAFALVILQRRLASSTYALLKSLLRRKEKLETLYKQSQNKIRPSEVMFDFEEIEDLSEEERWREEEIWETLSVAENREELKREIDTLSTLIDKAKKIVESEKEVKLRELKNTLIELNEKYPHEKIIIFTESRDTLEYLEKKIKSWGYTVNTIHGGMSLEKRIEAEKIFKNETQILVATEAAGEGINLQFCHLMINYDIPWNPNRLEQRMGRIHRYGQQKEVYVFNLVASDTREGKVLEKLFEKLKEIRNALGTDKVFDVISNVIYGKNLAQLLLEAAANARDIDEILDELDIKVDEEYISKVKEQLGESLATRYIDYTRIKEMAEKAREYRLIPEYTEAFFKKAFKLLGGKIRERRDGFLAIEKIPYEIRSIANEDYFKRSFGPLLKAYPKVTFDKDIAFRNPDAEFISFGHPLFEALLEYINRTFVQELRRGAVFYDPENKLNGYILFYEGELKDGTGRTAGKRLFAFYTDGKIVEEIQPSVLWDLAEGENKSNEHVKLGEYENLAIEKAIECLERYREELKKDRYREAKIKKKYGLKSLDYLIVKLDGELIELRDRKNRGENVDLAIRNKEEQIRNYENAKKELMKQIEQETKLTMSMPKLLGIIKVLPLLSVSPDEMKSSEEVEQIGMKIAMEYEIKNGRYPEDVSKENLGFDIRSKDKHGNVRYIEVKARANVGPVALTQNEWFKARRFGKNYYLYVILNAIDNPRLIIIEDPYSKLQPEEKVETVRFVIPSDQILKIGEN